MWVVCAQGCLVCKSKCHSCGKFDTGNSNAYIVLQVGHPCAVGSTD